MKGDYNSKYLQYNKENIDCTNFNLNDNGLDVNTIPESLSGLLASQGETGGSEIGISAYGTDEKRYGFDKDFVYKCLNNNDNELLISPTPPNQLPPPPPPCEVIVDTITGLGESPFSIAYDSVNERIYVTNSDSDDVYIIDTITNTVIDTITVGFTPTDIAYDSVNHRMYVTNSDIGNNTVSVINLSPRPELQQQSTNDIITTTGNNNNDHTIIKNMMEQKEQKLQQQQQQRSNDIITTTANNNDDTILKNVIEQKEEQKQIVEEKQRYKQII